MEDTKISRWDASEFLEDQADVDAYLEAAFETGDHKQITKALGNVARAKGVTPIANKTGLAREHLYTSFSENGNPTLQTLTAVVDVMGYRLAVIPKRVQNKVRS